MFEYCLHLVSSQHHWKVHVTLRAHDRAQLGQGSHQHFAVQEPQRTARLGLGGCADVFLNRQVLQEPVDVGDAPRVRVATIVEKNETPDPRDVRIFPVRGL